MWVYPAAEVWRSEWYYNPPELGIEVFRPGDYEFAYTELIPMGTPTLRLDMGQRCGQLHLRARASGPEEYTAAALELVFDGNYRHRINLDEVIGWADFYVDPPAFWRFIDLVALTFNAQIGVSLLRAEPQEEFFSRRLLCGVGI